MSTVSLHLLQLALTCFWLATSFSAAQESSPTAKRTARDHSELCPDETLAIFTNATTTSVGGLQSCLKNEQQTMNVRFQAIRVPGAEGGSTREFIRRATNEDFLRFYSTASEISEIDFATCARTASIDGMTAFSFDGFICTRYLMTNLPYSCNTDKLIIYVDVESDLKETSYYETDDFVFYTVDYKYRDSTDTWVVETEDHNDCASFTAEVSAAYSYLVGNIFASLYYDGLCGLDSIWNLLKEYDYVGGHKTGAAMTVILPHEFKRLKYQYFDDLCGTTVDDPPVLESFDEENHGEEYGIQVIFSHKGYGFFNLTEVSSECVVTFPAPSPGAKLIIQAYGALDGGAPGACDAGDRLTMQTSSQTKLFCGSDEDRTDPETIDSASENVVVTFTQEPGYSDLQSKGFVLHYVWRPF